MPVTVYLLSGVSYLCTNRELVWFRKWLIVNESLISFWYCCHHYNVSCDNTCFDVSTLCYVLCTENTGCSRFSSECCVY